MAFFEGNGTRVGTLRQMTWDIHPFMDKPCNTHLVFYHRVQHKVTFYWETAAAWIPILTRLTQLWIDGELPQATVEPGGIQVHLPFAPLFKGILKNVREVECGQL